MSLSYVQVYNDQVFDLLTPQLMNNQLKKLQIVNFQAQNMTVVQV